MLFYFYSAITRNQALLSSPLFWIRPDVNVSLGEVPRIVALGQSIIYPLFLFGVAIEISNAGKKVKLESLLLIIICSISIVIHGFRSYWYATIAALFVVILISMKGDRYAFVKIGKILTTVTIVSFLMVVLINYSPSLLASGPFHSVWERAVSPFSHSLDLSLSYRFEELQWAVSIIFEHPILGWGVSFPRLGYAWKLVNSGYLDLLIYYGFVGLLALFYVVITYWFYAWKRLDLSSDVFQRSLLVAFMGYTVLLLINAVSSPTFVEAAEVILLNVGFVQMISLKERKSVGYE